MTSKELISTLQAFDPVGDIQVSIGNLAITYINVEPYYYDGKLQIVEFNSDGRAVRGWRATEGQKIVINYDSLAELAAQDPNFEIVYRSEKHRQDYQVHDLERARQHREMEWDAELSDFQNWVFQTIQTQKPVHLGWVGRIKKAAEDYFRANLMGPNDPNVIPFDNTRRSWRDQRDIDYADSVCVEWDNYSRIIIRPRTDREKRA